MRYVTGYVHWPQWLDPPALLSPSDTAFIRRMMLAWWPMLGHVPDAGAAGEVCPMVGSGGLGNIWCAGPGEKCHVAIEAIAETI